MDEYVKSFLKLWELEDLITRFEIEEVNEKAFKCLSDDIIRELIPKLGKRAIFKKAYQEYRDALVSDVQPVVKQSTDTVQNEASSESPVEVKTESVEEEKAKEEDISVDIKIEVTDDDEHVVEVLHHNFTPKQNDDSSTLNVHCTKNPQPKVMIDPLVDFSEQDLKTAADLRALVKVCLHDRLKTSTFLTPTKRSILSEEIVKFLYDKHKGVLSNEILHDWARAVEVVFTSEVTAFYFRQSEDGSQTAGKLIDCYRKIRRLRSGQASG
ncbi:uncharacterized protein LOC131695700 [Topomyia yanbarensis]|uniref:uncharacterized protein LOC131695700 n=1 Tax=Topomyia yanbarensis TaxID=2498891 RepID=UPI00273BC19D|nr:uncharacterized protein LOC131695700 [Topomyia yanbarensis]